jgi:hypothetical protein
MAKAPNSKGKSTRKTAPAASSGGNSPAIKHGGRIDEGQIRERAYGIWIEEGRPHDREHAHWQRASLELQGEAR